MPRQGKKRKNHKYKKLKEKIRRLEYMVEEKYGSDTSNESDSSICSTNLSRCSTPPTPVQVIKNLVRKSPTPEKPEIAEIFGDSLKKPETSELSLHSEIVLRWEKYLIEGVCKEDINDLSTKYPKPSNFRFLGGPELNPEIKAVLTQSTSKTDVFLQKIQNEVGLALCALSGPLNNHHLTKSMPNDKHIKVFADATKILCNIQNKLSLHRRYSLLPNLDPAMKETIEKAPTDEFLFGKDLTSRCKNAKEMKRSGNELKKKEIRLGPNPLNFKRPLPRGKKKIAWNWNVSNTTPPMRRWKGRGGRANQYHHQRQ